MSCREVSLERPPYTIGPKSAKLGTTSFKLGTTLFQRSASRLKPSTRRIGHDFSRPRPQRDRRRMDAISNDHADSGTKPYTSPRPTEPERR